jgi:outer membrane protein OmpA-like peptidoglycan-associated protein
MKIKKALLSCLFLMGTLAVSAQDQQPKTEYVHNPYWYVQIQAGGQYTLGEIKFSKLISPNVQLAFGRQFTPVFGARLAVNAWQSRAGIDYCGYPYNMPGFAQGTTKWKWNYVAPGVDFMFSLSNLFAGYNPTRLVNVQAFAGVGANIAWGMDKTSNWDNVILLTNQSTDENISYAWTGTKVRAYGRVGLTCDFKVTDAVSIGAEVNANFLSDRYNGKKAGNADWYFNALVGAKINLGKTHTTRTIEPPKPVERVVEKVIERVVEKPCPPVVEPTKAVQEKKAEPFRRDVFFTISSTQISKTEMAKVKEVAEYMKANPNSTVEVTGYADKGTGNAKINKSLSQRRAQAVYNVLTRTYKIAASRIKVDSKGDTVQPFAKQIDNRVAICIAD